jgi:hypothetical protein
MTFKVLTWAVVAVVAVVAAPQLAPVRPVVLNALQSWQLYAVLVALLLAKLLLGFIQLVRGRKEKLCPPYLTARTLA